MADAPWQEIYNWPSKRDRDGNVLKGHFVMGRRGDAGTWEYRAWTQDEEADYVSRDAW